MRLGIKLKIDVSKIDKSKIFEGQKGKYVDLVTFIDTEKQDHYGNHGPISQEQSREERENGEKTPIIGNARIFYNKQEPAQNQQIENKAQNGQFDDDIPF